MGKHDLRYKLEHAGDIFIEMIEGIGSSITRPFRGIVLTKNINYIKYQRANAVYQIGERVVVIRKEQPEFFSSDPPVTQLFSKFDAVDKKLDDVIKEREERLSRIRGYIKSTVETVTNIDTQMAMETN